MSRSSTISLVMACIIILALITLTLSVARDTVRIKRAAMTAIGKVESAPLTLMNLHPPPPPTRHLDKTFARFAANLLIRAEKAGRRHTEPEAPPYFQVKLIHSNSGRNNAWLLSHGGQLWIVFRGTATKKEWKQDFELTQTPFMTRMVNKHINRMVYPKMAEAPQDETSLMNGKVHSGFLNVYMSLRDDILDIIRKTQPTRVCITGHSLGAALAQITTIDITQEFGVDVDTICFGSPRVGDLEFTEGLKNAHSFAMVKNTCDIVTDLPLAVQPILSSPSTPSLYTHPEDSTYYFTKNLGTWVNNHNMEVYLDYVMKIKG